MTLGTLGVSLVFTGFMGGKSNEDEAPAQGSSAPAQLPGAVLPDPGAQGIPATPGAIPAGQAQGAVSPRKNAVFDGGAASASLLLNPSVDNPAETASSQIPNQTSNAKPATTAGTALLWASSAIPTPKAEALNGAATWTLGLLDATGDRVGEAYDATKAKGAAAWTATKEEASVAVGAVKSRVEPVAVNVKNTGEALSLAPGAKTKAQVVGGVLNAILSGDLFDGQRPYSFADQKYAVVSINGMDNTFDDAKDMRDAVRQIFDVSDSAMISNEKGVVPYVQDVLQTTGYEALGLVDAPAVNAALAMKVGVKEKGEVYVIAHSQGSEVFHQALKLLTPEERAHVHYQGFGPETYIDAKAFGLAEARNVWNKGDVIPRSGNAGKDL
jgi:hypothetical protein